MEQGFTPLFPSASPGGSSPKFLNIVPGNASGNKPKAFQGVAASSQAQGTSAGGTSGQAPVITLKKDQDRITRICIQCKCGECIELDCEY